ncbi:MAG TPA: hypothetical protein DCP92_20680 [Nitrospiraceae bacterium]|jgi:DEAD/DEAH box helicase domain-containing protein|nr:hypothetical protein [Nitrospiraceae bacterium]
MDYKLISFLENKFKKEIRAATVLSPSEGTFSEFPKELNEKFVRVLKEQGITNLYSHQAEAFESVIRNQDAVIVSRTASGKTLSFLLPILNEYMLAEAPFTVMLLYPTKALSRDQEGTLGRLLEEALDQRKLGTFDGDTPPEERSRLQKTADFIITNPDMLHSGILPNHNRKWKSFLSRLRYIVVDEVHTYRGAFGSHVSNVFRRLERVCEIHGSNPVFICSSATVGNPGEHVNALFHREFRVIDNDGSPRPERKLYFVNPPVITSANGVLFRKGPGSVSVPLIREAARLGVRTICFCRARQEVERLYRAVTDGNPDLWEIVKPYRGGLLPNERRKLERDLFSGKIKVIISTNALELGIDIGDLDFCILSGHPGSVASFWQQAGRVGRKGNRAVVVFIAKDTPVDQYIVHHPEFITSTPIEQAWLNADNPYIIMQHLPCAAYEHPLRDDEQLFRSAAYKHAVEVLKANETIVPYREFYRYALSDYPSRGVNLRGMTDYNIEIYCGTEVIGEIDPIGARGTLYKDAIYQHLGERYMSMELDLDKKLCRVEKVKVDYYTEAEWENRVTLTSIEDSTLRNESQLQFGYVNVNKQAKLYKKIRERSFENIGYGPITLPPFEYDTTGFCLLPSKRWQKVLSATDKRYVSAAIYGLSYLLKKTSPSICMGDISDIDTDVSLTETGDNEWKSALYLYDSIEGGAGFGEKIYEKIEDVLKLCLQIMEECECKAGCPACVPSLPPGVKDEELLMFLIESNAAVECTISLIKNLLAGEEYMPVIKIEKQSLYPQITPPEEDQEVKKLTVRLNKAAELLKKKRERLH